MPDIQAFNAQKMELLKERLSKGISKPLMRNNIAQLQSFTRAEVLAACKSNPNHPLAFGKMVSATSGEHGPDDVLLIDKTDIEAIIQNREVVLETRLNPPFEEVRKKLGDELPTTSALDLGTEGEPEDQLGEQDDGGIVFGSE